MDGIWFQEQLKRAGRSQADLARHLRLNAASVSRLFKGERQLKLLEAAQLAAYLGQRDLPVRGRAEGGPDGAIILDSEPIDWAHRPAELQGARDAFAMFVTGTSMGEVLPEGTTIFVHPNLPARPGDLVVVERADQQALIKRLVRRTADTVSLRQYQPAADFDLPRASVRALYRVIGAIFP